MTSFFEGNGYADLFAVDHRIDMAGADAFCRSDISAPHRGHGFFDGRPDLVKRVIIVGLQFSVDEHVGSRAGAHNGPADKHGGAAGQDE